MNILHINFIDDGGGAAKAAYRLNNVLVNNGINSKMLVVNKITTDCNVVKIKCKTNNKYMNKFRSSLEKLYINQFMKNEKKIFSLNIFGNNLMKNEEVLNADIIHLHWINNNTISMNQLKKLFLLKKNIVWTLHDMWPITGGCHYTNNCEKYTKKCYNCEFLNKPKVFDISSHTFNKKLKVYNNSNINIVTCSNWLRNCVQQSALLKEKNIITIPNTLDSNIFKKMNKVFAKNKLGINVDKKVILFGAMNSTHDKRKGWCYLKEALKILKNEKKDIILLIFGSDNDSEVENLQIECKFMGHIKDEYILQLIYNASDVLVTPSLEDNLPNTVMEGLACGTPVVAFDIGGLSDMINHKENGYLVKPKDFKDLKSGILWTLSQDEKVISEKCIEKFKTNFSNEIVVEKYIKLYKKILNK